MSARKTVPRRSQPGTAPGHAIEAAAAEVAGVHVHWCRYSNAVFDERPDSGLAVVSLDLSIARALRRIPRAVVPEMPDRIIAATALYLGLPLVTRDLRIRSADITTIW